MTVRYCKVEYEGDTLYFDFEGELPEGAVEVPRLPGNGEYWDGEKFVTDLAIKADVEASPDHIARAHQHKVLEALLVKAGMPVEGLLSEEAPMRGVTLLEMADLVLDEASAFIEAEVARMRLKTGVALEE